MFMRLPTLLISLFIINISLADDNIRNIDNNLYVADEIVDINNPNADDVFAIGKNITIDSTVTGNTHLIGKDLHINADIGQSLYGVGEDILLRALINGDANLVAKKIYIDGTISDDLRTIAKDVVINQDIGDNAQIAAKNATINATIFGNASITAKNLTFGPNAHIKGSLTIYKHHKQSFVIPSSVIQANKIIYKTIDEDDDFYIGYHDEHHQAHHVLQALFSIFFIFIAALLMRNKINKFYQRTDLNIRSTIGYGFLVLSVLVGGSIVSALTIIAIPLSLLLIVCFAIALVLGYLIGAYLIGAYVYQKIRKSKVESKMDIFIASIIAALFVGLLTSIAWFGWVLCFVIVLFGIGAINPWRLQK